MLEKRNILLIGAAFGLGALLKHTQAPITPAPAKKSAIPTEKDCKQNKPPQWEAMNPALPWWNA